MGYRFSAFWLRSIIASCLGTSPSAITSVIAEGEVPRQEAITISDNAADAELEHPEIENNNSNSKELQEQPWHLVTTKKRGRETSKQESPHATPSKQNINETNIHQTVSSNVQNG